MKKLESLALIVALICLAINSCKEIKEIYKDQTKEEVIIEDPIILEPEPEISFFNPEKDGLQKWDNIRTGTIYKPYSDRKPSRIVFISGPQFQQQFNKVLIGGKEAKFEKWSEWDSSRNYDKKLLKTAKQLGHFDYNNNAPLRQVWRTNLNCQEILYGSNIEAFSNDKIYRWKINNPCERH